MGLQTDASPTPLELKDMAGLQPTRVMHVVLGTQVGGMEKLLVEFAKFADRGRFDLAFTSLQTRGGIANEIEACHWPVYELGKQPGLRPGVVWKLAAQLRRDRTQVVHTHNTSAFIYGVLAGKLACVQRIVHTRHGQRFGASNRQTLLFRMLSKLVYRIVSVSEDGSRLSALEGVSPDRLCTILNGIDLRSFGFVGATAYGPAVIVARLSKEKDLVSLIHAVAIVMQTAEDASRFSLKIVGDGSERTHLEALSKQLGLTRCIEFLGQQSNVEEILALASMFVLPSLTEGISLTLLEAMACGLPVVATRVGGTTEVVVDEVTGLLVPPGCPKAMAAAIVRLHRDPHLSQRMGELGRQRVEQKFSVESMVRAYEELYLGEVV